MLIETISPFAFLPECIITQNNSKHNLAYTYRSWYPTNHRRTYPYVDRRATRTIGSNNHRLTPNYPTTQLATLCFKPVLAAVMTIYASHIHHVSRQLSLQVPWGNSGDFVYTRFPLNPFFYLGLFLISWCNYLQRHIPQLPYLSVYVSTKASSKIMLAYWTQTI